MKWLLVFKEKYKIIFLLPVMAVLIIVLIIASKNEVTHLDKSVSSIYHDRLVAGRAITQIMDLHYENHFLIDKYIQADSFPENAPLEDQMRYNYKQMDSLMHELKKTVLVREEADAIQAYEQKTQTHRTFQQQIFGFSKENDKASLIQYYGQQEERTFQSVLTLLRQLSMVQPRVGKDLLTDSQHRIRIIQELSFLEITFVIILFAVIEMMVFLMLAKVSNGGHVPDQKFRLN